jgi:hypothetical protein
VCLRTDMSPNEKSPMFIPFDDGRLGRYIPWTTRPLAFKLLTEKSRHLDITKPKVTRHTIYKCNVCLASPLQSYLTSPPAKSQSDPKRVGTHQSRMLYRSRNACVNQGTHRPKGRNIRDFSVGTHWSGTK